MTFTYLIMGAGRSGIAASRLLLYHGAHVELFDDQEESRLNYFKSSDLAGHKHLRVCFGGQRPSLSLDSYKALIVSPGISFEHELIKKALDSGLTIMSEIDCAYEFLPPLKIIGVTGTNGKSTTTIMIEHILRTAQTRAYACGNLGVPLCELALKAQKEPIEYLVVELSSYQLENTHKLKLDAAIILNITPDHLDRYDNINQYQQAKLKILELLKPDNKSIGIVNRNLSNIISNKHKIIFFDQKDANILERININGIHNQENALAAFLVAQAFNISEEYIFSGLASYTPLPHRCELVGIKNNVAYINDSKGTTVVAVTKALSLFHNTVHLLLGGQAKGEDFSALKPEYFPNIKGYYIFGQAEPEIKQALNTPKAHSFENLSAAFKSAQLSAKAGDTILLSPGCASFDQFKDYTERGELFRSLVENIICI